jgi:hypothetical protein
MPKQWLLRFASAIVILNLADALFTILYTTSGLAREGNPFMETVLTAGPVLFVLTKVMLVTVAVLFLWRYRHRSSVVLGLLGSTAVYVVVIGYHLSAVPLLINRL